jgi:hypothetical protein
VDAGLAAGLVAEEVAVDGLGCERALGVRDLTEQGDEIADILGDGGVHR